MHKGLSFPQLVMCVKRSNDTEPQLIESLRRHDRLRSLGFEVSFV